MAEKSSRDFPKIGYVYHYPNIEHPTEKFRLDIFISSTPTEQHFDVQKAQFFVKSPQETLTHLTVTHPWDYEHTARVCAGVVIMEDRKGKKEEAFTFGGELRIDGQESQTVCNLVSPAPIIEISGARPLNGFFIEELEIILAEYRSNFSDHRAYEMRLCKTDPYRLYLACLEEVIEKLKSFQHKDQNIQQLLVYLHAQEHRLVVAGLLKEPIPTLKTIFDETKSDAV